MIMCPFYLCAHPKNLLPKMPASVQFANVIMSQWANEPANVETQCFASPQKKVTAENASLRQFANVTISQWANEPANVETRCFASPQKSYCRKHQPRCTPTNSVRHPAIASSPPWSSARAPEIGRTATPIHVIAFASSMIGYNWQIDNQIHISCQIIFILILKLVILTIGLNHFYHKFAP